MVEKQISFEGYDVRKEINLSPSFSLSLVGTGLDIKKQL